MIFIYFQKINIICSQNNCIKCIYIILAFGFNFLIGFDPLSIYTGEGGFGFYDPMRSMKGCKNNYKDPISIRIKLNLYTQIC